MRLLLTILFSLLIATPAMGVKIADITRLDGERTNVLTGLGLVFGLRGTGDGGDFLPAIRPLATMLGNFADPSTVRELAAVQNVALVSLTVTVPATGVRDGDRLDVYITSIGAASSLRGGRLFVTPLTGPIPGGGIYALAEGAVVIEDATVPTHGVVRGGAVMEADLMSEVIDNGRITLILEDPAASWTTASTIAQIINDAEGMGEVLATALDAKNVVVTIPPAERRNPNSFISRVQRLPVPMVPTEARVIINERTGTMIITGDVQISPVVISHRGLTITTVAPQPIPTPRTPVVSERHMVAVDPAQQGGARLHDLVTALDQLKVPAEDRIIIVRELHRTGRLHAKLVIE